MYDPVFTTFYDSVFTFFIIVASAGTVFAFLYLWISESLLKKKREYVKSLFAGLRDFSPDELREYRERTVTGIYVIHNHTREKYYVGQSHNVIRRLQSHFGGRGNRDVYADYEAGDIFTVRLLSLDQSGYSSLDAFEKDTIEAYHAYTDGYNKTRGNGN